MPIRDAETQLALLSISNEQDVVEARQRGRIVAAMLGFEEQDQVRIATAISKLARNAFRYAGGGAVRFSATTLKPYALRITVSDQGGGIEQLQSVLDGTYVSKTGMGRGLSGVRRLMDEFVIETGSSGTEVQVAKYLPVGRAVSAGSIRTVAARLTKATPDNPFAELQRQNQELILALSELEERRRQMELLNRELEETNRGVVALYAELDERADFLRKASETKSEFLSNMTHEFRTPLNSILSISQMLLDRYDGPLTSEQERQVGFVKNAARGLSDMVNDLLDLAKVEAGKIAVRPAPFEAADMFGALRGMLKPLLEQNRSVALVFEDPDGIPPLYGDEGKVAQILRNFISNGLKYTERGEVRVKAAAEPAHCVTFLVEDTGIGIEATDLGRIFEEFVQIEHNLQHVRKGTGLGLPLSRRLAGLLGGSVGVRSEPGLGSTFTLTIPLRYKGDTEGSIVTMQDERREKDLPVTRILVIDDDEADRYVLRKLLAGAEISIFEASSGRIGLEMAETLMPDIIFLDLVMPEMKGTDVYAALKAHRRLRAIPIVIHSSKPLDDADREHLQGCAAFVSKAVDNPESKSAYLKDLIRSIMAAGPQKDVE